MVYLVASCLAKWTYDAKILYRARVSVSVRMKIMYIYILTLHCEMLSFGIENFTQAKDLFLAQFPHFFAILIIM